MVQDAGAEDVFEGLPKFACALDWKLIDFEILKRVRALEFARECDARCADVDADDARVWPTHRVVRRL